MYYLYINFSYDCHKQLAISLALNFTYLLLLKYLMKPTLLFMRYLRRVYKYPHVHIGGLGSQRYRAFNEQKISFGTHVTWTLKKYFRWDPPQFSMKFQNNVHFSKWQNKILKILNMRDI